MTVVASARRRHRLEVAGYQRRGARRPSEALLALMRRRRSLRDRADLPVDRALIENAFEATASAPTGANQQACQFVGVADAAVKARMRTAAERGEELLYRERASREYLEAVEPMGTDSSKPHLTEAPYSVVVVEHAWSGDTCRDKSKNDPGGRQW